MKNKTIKTLCAVALIALCTAFAAQAQKTNFSGSWLLNEQQSEFNGQPPAAVFKQLTVLQTNDSLKIAGLKFDGGATGPETTYPINGNQVTITLSTGKHMTANLQWSDNGKTLTRKSAYFSAEDPTRIDYRSEEVWNLSDDRKTLTLSRTFIRDLGSLSLKAIYDKK